MSTALAPREQQYVSAVAHGKSDKEIAREMDCGLGGVHSTSRRARFKLNAKNRVDLVIKAIREGYIELSLVLFIVCQCSLFNIDLQTDIERNQPRGPRTRQRASQKNGSRNSRTRFLRMRMRNQQPLVDLVANIGSEVYQTYDLPEQQIWTPSQYTQRFTATLQHLWRSKQKPDSLCTSPNAATKPKAQCSPAPHHNAANPHHPQQHKA